MNILFHSNQLGIRGTETALYDMAHYTEKLLGHTSYIAAPAGSDMTTYEKFYKRFEGRVFIYDSFDTLELSCKEYDITHAYMIKGGMYDGKVIPGVKTFIHCVFDCSQPHGDVYCGVSEWLGEKFKIDYLPHIVSLPEVKGNYRTHIGIPKDAIVFGRHGGFDQFDIPYLSDVISTLIHRTDIYFLLMNTKPFNTLNYPRVIYLDSTTDVEVKTAFINTCDAMLHGRTEGESFGLSIAEFIHQNKPVITNIEARDRNHIHMLKDKGFYYSNASELYTILTTFNGPNYIKQHNLKHLVKDFKPETVINKFNEMFLCE